MSTAVELGRAEIQAKADIEPVRSWLAMKAARAPALAEAAMKRAVAWWHTQALPRIPVRGSINRRQRRAGIKGSLYSKVGRGMLRKSTQPFVQARGGELIGGILAGTHYAIWLAAGTRRIAGGRVLRWRPGDPLIEDWPAKRARLGIASMSKGKHRQARIAGNERAALPIILPWQRSARDKLVEELKAKL